MEMTKRLKNALLEFEQMKYPTTSKILRGHEYECEARCLEELMTAVEEAKTAEKQPLYAVHIANGDNQTDETFAEKGVEVILINWDAIENDTCPYCEAHGLDWEMNKKQQGYEICVSCGFDSRWNGEQILAWVIEKNREESTDGNIS